MNFNRVTRAVSRTGLKLQKHSPQILFYGGLVGVVATTVMASRATLKAAPVAQEFTRAREELDAQCSMQVVDDNTYTTAVVQQYAWVSARTVRLYVPTVVVGALSIAALTKSHTQLTSRNTALTVAYTGLFRTFEAYRARAREQYGPDADQQLLHGTTTVVSQVEGKNGKVVEQEDTLLNRVSTAALSASFDKNTSGHWVSDPGYNQFFLQNQQDWSNILLQRNGHLFLNEVFDMLDMPRTKEGQLLGWVTDDLGNNDTFISFGFEQDGEFVAGYSKDAMLHFNIHGIVLDLIK